jgi:O-antigen/teichoic acid export membrane protein
MEPLPEAFSLPELAEAQPPTALPGPPAPEPIGAAGPTGAAAPAGRLLRRAGRWFKLLSAYFTAQALTQLLGVSAGLLLVRTMPVRQFALYTLALSVVTFFTFLSDLGSTTSLFYFFHRSSAGEPGEFPLYLAAVRSLRRLAFLIGAAAVAVALPRAALAKGFGGTETALATAGVLLCVWFQIGASLSVLALRLADRYGESYRAEVAGGGMRLVSAAVLVAATRLYAWLAVLGNAVAIATVSVLARPEGARRPARAQLAPYRRRVLRYLLPTLPSAFYFSVQGPLVVWLSATFGATRNIAEVGALSRLGMVVGLFSNLSGIVLLPRLSRIADERLYRRRCIQFGALVAAVALSLYLAVLAFPRGLLALLGEHYAGLDSELLLVVCGSGLTLVGGFLVSVNLARSWTRWQTAAVAAMAIFQATLVKTLPLGTTRGVLTFNVLSAAVGLTMQLIIAIVGFARPHLVHWE